MIFLTVGTESPFDRLVRSVDDLVEYHIIEEPIFAQIGRSKYRPRNFEYTECIQKRTFDELVEKSSAVISHAGVSMITAALEYNKPLLVVPRLKQYGENVDNNQIAIAEKFQRAGLLLAAYGEHDLPFIINRLGRFRPSERRQNLEKVISRIALFIKGVEAENGA